MMLEPLHKPSQWATVEALSVLARTDNLTTAGKLIKGVSVGPRSQRLV